MDSDVTILSARAVALAIGVESQRVNWTEVTFDRAELLLHEEMEEFRLEFTVSSVCRGDIFCILTTTNHNVVCSGTFEVLLECKRYKQAYLIMAELTGTCDL